MKKGDAVLIVLLLAVAAALLVLSLTGDAQQEKYARICVDGDQVELLSLDEDASYTVQNDYGLNIIVVSDGEVMVSRADCPDGSCTGYAPIDRTGECIVCLPHHLSVTIIGGDDAPEVDAVTS